MVSNEIITGKKFHGNERQQGGMSSILWNKGPGIKDIHSLTLEAGLISNSSKSATFLC